MTTHLVGLILQLWLWEKIFAYPRFVAKKRLKGHLRYLATCPYCLTPYILLAVFFIPYNEKVLWFTAAWFWVPHIVVFLNKNRVIENIIEEEVHQPLKKVDEQ